MYALATEARSAGRTIVSTTTTKIFPPTAEQSPGLVLTEKIAVVDNIVESLKEYGHITVGSRLLPNGKVDAPDDATLSALAQAADLLIIEADGAAHRSIKAPESWEPVIPDYARLVIPVAGLDCLDRPATDERVFRLSRFLAVTGLAEGEPISAEAIGRLLGHVEGAQKGVPAEARITPFLNKLDALGSSKDIAEVARVIFRYAGRRIERLVTGKLRDGVAIAVFGR